MINLVTFGMSKAAGIVSDLEHKPMKLEDMSPFVKKVTTEREWDYFKMGWQMAIIAAVKGVKGQMPKEEA